MQKFSVPFKEVRHANANAGDELRLVPSSKHPTEFKITAGYGFSSYLCSKCVGSRTYQYAFFGTASYNESYDAMMVASTSVCILYPAVRNSTGAVKFRRNILSLCQVSSWQYAFFGTSAYISDGGYSAGKTLKIIFHKQRSTGGWLCQLGNPTLRRLRF